MKKMNARLQGTLTGLTLTVLITLGTPGLAMSASPADGAQTAQSSQSGGQKAGNQPEQANDGSDYIAAWSVMGEICEDKYPQMKPAIDEFWTKRWNKETRERVAAMKKGPDFQAKVAKHRKKLAERKDEILAQCDKLFMGGAH